MNNGEFLTGFLYRHASTVYNLRICVVVPFFVKAFNEVARTAIFNFMDALSGLFRPIYNY